MKYKLKLNELHVFCYHRRDITILLNRESTYMGSYFNKFTKERQNLNYYDGVWIIRTKSFRSELLKAMYGT